MDAPELRYLVADYETERSHALSGFAGLRRKTWETLYGRLPPSPAFDSSQSIAATTTTTTTRTATATTSISSSSSSSLRADKSPKGSVDEPIRSLVNLINAHPDFCTLSSCSGRIAIYDTAATTTTTTTTTALTMQEPIENDTYTEQQQQQNHGKGSTGGWILAAHDEIDPPSVLAMLRAYNEDKIAPCDNYSQSCKNQTFLLTRQSLHFEPMLLHIAACHLTRGQELLQLALQGGFRESGLVVTDTRVTVAIRTHALSLHIPLPTSISHTTTKNTITNESCPLLSDEYLLAVLHDCNRRLHLNHTKMQRLAQSIQDTLFVRKIPTGLGVRITTPRLPRLNLWGHAAVVLQSEEPISEDNHPPRHNNNDNSVMHTLVFGGYGTGPALSDSTWNLVTSTLQQQSDQKTTVTTCQRSPHVYRLTSYDNGQTWSDTWERLSSCRTHDHATLFGIPVEPCTFTARQGLTANVLSDGQTVFLFGGRQGPAKAMDECLFYRDGVFYRPRTLHHTTAATRCQPSPRWGHSTTVLPGNRIVILGGRNQHSTFSDMFLGSFVKVVENLDTCLQWNKLVVSPTTPVSTIPRCFHSAVALGDHQIMVWGGTSDASVLVSSPVTAPDPCLYSVEHGTTTVRILHANAFLGNINYIGHTLTTGIPDEIDCRRHHLLMIGGTAYPSTDPSCRNDESKLLKSIVWINKKHSDPQHQIEENQVMWQCNQQDLKLEDLQSLLVHHSVLPLPGIPHRLLVVGGGVQGFAFQQMFADSFILEMDWIYDQPYNPGVIKPPQAPGEFQSRKNHVPGKATTTQNISTETNVFYVHKLHAKEVKTALESENLLDKQFRMSKAEPSGDVVGLHDPVEFVAVPVMASALEFWKKKQNEPYGDDSAVVPPGPLWLQYVQAHGRQEVLLSSSMFARRQKGKR